MKKTEIPTEKNLKITKHEKSERGVPLGHSTHSLPLSPSALDLELRVDAAVALEALALRAHERVFVARRVHLQSSLLLEASCHVPCLHTMRRHTPHRTPNDLKKREEEHTHMCRGNERLK